MDRHFMRRFDLQAVLTQNVELYSERLPVDFIAWVEWESGAKTWGLFEAFIISRQQLSAVVGARYRKASEFATLNVDISRRFFSRESR
jgi:hypothetical protein